MHPILDIQHATVYRGDTCVFSDFSFAPHEGEHGAIIGPNGAGKSTLRKFLSGEAQPSIGRDQHLPVRRRAVECVGRPQAFGDSEAGTWYFFKGSLVDPQLRAPFSPVHPLADIVHPPYPPIDLQSISPDVPLAWVRAFRFPHFALRGVARLSFTARIRRVLSLISLLNPARV